MPDIEFEKLYLPLPAYQCLRLMPQAKPSQVLERTAQNSDLLEAACVRAIRGSSHYDFHIVLDECIIIE